MINKQNLWFVTLFSLILVLGIYYVSMDDEALKTLASANESKEVVEIDESNVLVALRVAEDEELMKSMQSYQDILLDEEATIEEKNDAYEALQALNTQKGEVEKIENLIKENYKYDCFVKINGDAISVVVSSKEHSTEIANKIIRSVQSLYDKQKYITVKFEA